jgi:hypothetical protein
MFLHSNMCDFFLGIWSNGKEKPFKYVVAAIQMSRGFHDSFFFNRYSELQRQRLKISERHGKADRKAPQQPNVFTGGGDGGTTTTRYNLRRFSELPYHLVGAERTEELFREVLFNYSWLHAKISSGPIGNVLDDFVRALDFVKKPDLKRQVGMKYLAKIIVLRQFCLFYSETGRLSLDLFVFLT